MWGDRVVKKLAWQDMGRCGEVWGDQVVKELTALDELHQQAELGLRLEDVVEADDVRVVQRLEDPRLEQRTMSGSLTARSCSFTSVAPLLREGLE